MENIRFLKLALQDIRTYRIMTQNENYKERLLEAYKYVKDMGIDSFYTYASTRHDVGAFSYAEITIFDRLNDPEYYSVIANGYNMMDMGIEEWINNPHIGDDLASYGKLGNRNLK